MVIKGIFVKIKDFLSNPIVNFLLILSLLIIIIFLIVNKNDNNFDIKAYNELVKNKKLEKEVIDGDTLYKKYSFLVNEIQDLKNYNVTLYDELQRKINHNNNLGTITDLSEIETDFHVPTNEGRIDNELLYQDSIFTLKFNYQYEDSGLKQIFNTETQLKAYIENDTIMILNDPTEIIKNNIKVKLFLVRSEKNDTIIVSGYSKSPYISFTDINSVKIINKKPKFDFLNGKINLWVTGGLSSDNNEMSIIKTRPFYGFGATFSYTLFDLSKLRKK